jgi:hypothetical protein
LVLNAAAGSPVWDFSTGGTEGQQRLINRGKGIRDSDLIIVLA